MDKFTNWYFPIMLIIGIAWTSLVYKSFELAMSWISAISLLFIAMALIYITNYIDKKKIC